MEYRGEWNVVCCCLVLVPFFTATERKSGSRYYSSRARATGGTEEEKDFHPRSLACCVCSFGCQMTPDGVAASKDLISQFTS
jgi:hypothetical protein